MQDINRDDWTEKERQDEVTLNEEGRKIHRSIFGDEPEPVGHTHYVLSRDNVAIAVGMGTWAVWFEHEHKKAAKDLPNQCVVGREEWTDPRLGEIAVSTVFLGLDHSYSKHGARRIFETLIFVDGHTYLEDKTKPFGYLVGAMWRYATYQQAREGHERIVRLTKMALTDQWAIERWRSEVDW